MTTTTTENLCAIIVTEYLSTFNKTYLRPPKEAILILLRKQRRQIRGTYTIMDNRN